MAGHSAVIAREDKVSPPAKDVTGQSIDREDALPNLISPPSQMQHEIADESVQSFESSSLWDEPSIEEDRQSHCIALANDCLQTESRLESKNILVTGGLGFVGSHLVDSLMIAGHNVTVIDNLWTGKLDNIKHWLAHRNFHLIIDDIENQNADSITSNFHQVYHLASPASPKHYLPQPIKTIKANTLGTLNMLELARKNGARFVLASTSEVYGSAMEHPQSESYWGNVNPVGPRSCYDESKRLSEALAFAYHNQMNLNIGIARIFNTYGPRMQSHDGRVVSNFIVQALRNHSITIYGDGSQTRSFQYISDLIEGLRRLMAKEDVTGPINLGNPDEMSVSELFSEIKLMLGSSSSSQIEYKSLPVDDPPRRRPDIGLAFQLLNWKPKVKLVDGLNRTIRYFEKQMRTLSEVQ